MAFNYQNLGGLDKQPSFGELYGKGLENYEKARDYNRKKELQNAFDSMVTSAGTLPTEFIKEAAKRGIGIEGLEEYFKNLKSNTSTAKQIAEDSSTLEALGRDPDTGREWSGSLPTKPAVEAPPVSTGVRTWMGMKPSEWISGPAAESEKQTEERKKSDAEWDASVATNPVQVKTTEDRKEETVLNPATGIFETQLSQPKVESKAVYIPQDPGEYNMPVGADTLPRQYSAVEEMLRRKGKSPFDISTSGSSDATGPVFDYNVLSESAGGVQLKAGIDNALRKMGKTPSQSSVDDLLTYAASTVPAPRTHFKDGKLDIESTLADRNEYAAKVNKAKQDMIEKLVSGNTTAIGETIAQAGNERAIAQRKEEAESAEADIIGRRTGGAGNNFRPVSKDEATKGRTMSEAYRDLAAAKNIPDLFPKAMQAAASKLKGNQIPVTMDNIVAELVAQGAVPSNTAITIKALLSNGVSPQDLITKYVLSTGSELAVDSPRIDEYITQNLEDMTAGLASVGFNVPSVKTAKPGDKKPGDLKPADITKKTIPKGKIGSKNVPILYTKGMKTEKGKFYKVGDKILEGKN